MDDCEEDVPSNAMDIDEKMWIMRNWKWKEERANWVEDGQAEALLAMDAEERNKKHSYANT